MEIQHMGQDSTEFVRVAVLELYGTAESTAAPIKHIHFQVSSRNADQGSGICISERPLGEPLLSVKKV